MNRVQLTGRFATEVAFKENELGREASFIIEVDEGDEPQFFRVRCVGAAADAVEEEARERPSKGQPVSVVSALRQAMVEHGDRGSVKTMYVEAAAIDLSSPSSESLA